MKIYMLHNATLERMKKDAVVVHISEQINNLKKLGNEVHLIAPNLDVFPSKSFYIRAIYNLFRNTYIFFQFITFIFLHGRPDVIYSRYDVLSPLLILPKLLRRPWIVELNEYKPDEVRLNTKSHFYIWLTNMSLKFNCKNADGIVSVTQGIKEEITTQYNIPDEKIVVIENGANTDLFKPMGTTKARKKLNLDRNNSYIGFVGHLAPWQGVEYLIKAAPLILKEIPNTKFLVVGDGSMNEELINLAAKAGVADNFIFTGAVPYEEVPKYINASDVCVAPFITERNERIGLSPLKIYEYLACGKPVASSRIPNLEFIEEQNAGILAEPENIEELSKAIIRILKDEKLREDMGENGRGYVVKNHRWEVVAKRVAEVCESVVREHKNKRR